jgi:hypothetical protein
MIDVVGKVDVGQAFADQINPRLARIAPFTIKRPAHKKQIDVTNRIEGLARLYAGINDIGDVIRGASA